MQIECGITMRKVPKKPEYKLKIDAIKFRFSPRENESSDFGTNEIISNENPKIREREIDEMEFAILTANDQDFPSIGSTQLFSQSQGLTFYSSAPETNKKRNAERTVQIEEDGESQSIKKMRNQF